MDPDKYQQAWKAHSSETRVTVDADVLLKEVQRNQGNFRATILLRDFREVGIAILMIPLWFYLGITFSLPWTWYLTVPAIVWGAGFILVDRKRHKQKPSEPNDSLLSSVEESLTQVEHQIWLLRNVFWWYLLPYAIPIQAFFTQTAWLTSQDWLVALGTSTSLFAFLFALYYFVYYLNQLAVRKQLEPRRQELLTLLACLSDEPTSKVSGDYPILMGAEHVACSRRRMVIASLCAMTILLIGVPAILFFASSFDEGYPKRSPFAAVRWQESQPEVRVNDIWFKLVSLDEIPASKIVAFSQRTYGSTWQKRFEEDLVELLTRMGHPPTNTVTLQLQSLTSSETQTFEDVPMTKANRSAIRNAAQARKRSEQQQEVRPNLPMAEQESDAGPHAQALESIRASYGLSAMTAFAMRDGVIVERATVGTRSSKGSASVGPDVRWHIGGNTQAMTATLAGILVEEDLLQWDTTIGEILGEAAPNMDSGHRETTLAMLLHHTSGITANINWFAAPQDRVACAAQILSSPPESQPGIYAYSNAGYVVAGAIMEVVTGKCWEDLMIEKLFEPLGMADTSFGPPLTPGAPWGHRSGVFGWKPMRPAERGSDNAPVMGPAGTVHTTLDDYARFLAAHMAGAQGRDGIVTAETFRRLHTSPEGGVYAMGWVVVDRSWAGGQALMCVGTNPLWYAAAWLAPEKDMAFFAATNAAGDIAFTAVNEAIESLIGQHLGQRTARQAQAYPKRAPFSAIRWEENAPVVKIDSAWFTLVSLDEIAAGDIVAFSQRTYKKKWQKRFEEDLVEVMAGMGHEPKDTVQLVVMPLGSSTPRTLEGVAMTEANRKAIWDSARGRIER